MAHSRSFLPFTRPGLGSATAGGNDRAGRHGKRTDSHVPRNCWFCPEAASRSPSQSQPYITTAGGC